MDVIEKAKKGWHRWQLFKEVEPGHRFQTRYNNHRQRRERGETSRYGRIFNLAGRCKAEKAGTMDQRTLDRLACRGEDPCGPDLRRRAGIRSLLLDLRRLK
jgi:hypothetical protein